MQDSVEITESKEYLAMKVKTDKLYFVQRKSEMFKVVSQNLRPHHIAGTP